MTTAPHSLAAQTLSRLRRRRAFALALPALVLAYLAYAAISFDLAGLAGRLRPDNAAILLSDFWSHKVHVTMDNRSQTLTAAIEGESKGRYPENALPGWIQKTGGVAWRIDLKGGAVVTYGPGTASFFAPGYGTVTTTLVDGKVALDTPPGPRPAWINITDTRVSITRPEGRFAFSRAKAETFRYFPGWELFFFTLDSPFSGQSLGQIAGLLTTAPRIDPAQSNLSLMLDHIWNNQMWRHGDVAWAMVETLLMAGLGTLSAGIIALPLAMLAASNLMPVAALRFGLRRLFDLVRGVDALIWTILLSRAFGPCPMTGALAILITDTGVLGKTYAEALENIDEKPLEGLISTGAAPALRARFAIWPQIAPVIASQMLYMLESNTRSATVIGAIVGGGIGLLLTQAMATQKDWEEVAYYLTLIVLLVMAMDSAAGWLRRKLIKGV